MLKEYRIYVCLCNSFIFFLINCILNLILWSQFPAKNIMKFSQILVNFVKWFNIFSWKGDFSTVFFLNSQNEFHLHFQFPIRLSSIVNRKPIRKLDARPNCLEKWTDFFSSFLRKMTQFTWLCKHLHITHFNCPNKQSVY